ncbi:PaaX family transcriptional regulator C-terminal domain-containing protein [Mycobacterium sp. NPDC050853]|uniref:PaaX family transcriptional regulator C-terminal domain-containing protein n=1 Tax=Mycobacterium sp. NPDC050853 TaxID=3155160 RepID=UPI0033FE087F
MGNPVDHHPMTARSVILSLLLGAHPAELSVREIRALTTLFGISDTTVRVALTRMVSAGDVTRTESGYRLAERLQARQLRQDEACDPHRRAWNGDWTQLVVTSVGRDARDRNDLRTTLRQRRFGELREGVWLRPDNLEIELPPSVADHVWVLHTRTDDPAALAAQLWDLPGWSLYATDLLKWWDQAGTIPARFVLAAAMVRHLLADPVLPDELLPPEWPADEIRSRYREFKDELVTLRDPAEMEEVPYG